MSQVLWHSGITDDVTVALTWRMGDGTVDELVLPGQALLVMVMVSVALKL
jgi:hypothetical protein